MLLCLLSLLATSICSQELNTSLHSEIPLDAETFVGVDDFKSIYYINNNILYKRTSKKEFSYSNIELGRLSSVNIHNPFKIILFYANFNAAISLDNNLNELTQRIDFTKGTLFNNVSFVTGSSQNNLWLYADDNKLHLFDYQDLKEILQTQPMTFYDATFLPKSIASTYKKVWLLSEKGILEFNEYGIYTQTYELKGLEYIFPFQKGFIFVQDGSFFYQDQTDTIPIGLDHKINVKNISVNRSSIFLYDGKTVFEYQIKQ